MLGRWQAVAQTADIADPHPNEVKDAAKDRRAAVAEVGFADAVAARRTANESPPPSGGGLEAGRGTQRGGRKRIIAVAQVANALLYRLGNSGQQFLHRLQIADIRRNGSLQPLIGSQFFKLEQQSVV